jgi:hypothetical protein
MILSKMSLLHMEKFLPDGAYDACGTRLLIIRKLKGIPFIALNPRSCKGQHAKKKRWRDAESFGTNGIARIS